MLYNIFSNSPNSQSCYLFTHLGEKKGLMQYFLPGEVLNKEGGGQCPQKQPMKCPCKEDAQAYPGVCLLEHVPALVISYRSSSYSFGNC